MTLTRSTDITELVTALVSAGQPHCENSLDGPLQLPQESAAAEEIAPMLKRLGFTTRSVGRDEGRSNLVAVRRFGPGRTLLLNDHLDTYPAGPPERWSTDPYRVVERDSRLYGRGTSDTRGNIAAMLLALERVVANPPDTGTVVVVLSVDEERNGGAGALWLLDCLNPWPDASITIEPTAWSDNGTWGLGVAVRHTGHGLLDVELSGRSSHIWRPDTGVNPARSLVRILAGLAADPPGGWPMSIIDLDAGERGMAQFTPLRARARLAVVGLPADAAADDVRRTIEERVAQAVEAGCSQRVTFVEGPTFVAGTELLTEAEPVVQALSGAYERAAGMSVRLYTKPAYCDTIRFAHAGIPAVTFGPGEDGWSVYDESIGVDRIQLAISVLADAISSYLEDGSPAGSGS